MGKRCQLSQMNPSAQHRSQLSGFIASGQRHGAHRPSRYGKRCRTLFAVLPRRGTTYRSIHMCSGVATKNSRLYRVTACTSLWPKENQVYLDLSCAPPKVKNAVRVQGTLCVFLTCIKTCFYRGDPRAESRQRRGTESGGFGL